MDFARDRDRNTLAASSDAWACKGAGVKPLIGCRLDFDRRTSLLAYPVEPRRLAGCRRLLASARCAPRRANASSASRCRRHADGIAFIAWPQDDLDAFEAELPRLC